MSRPSITELSTWGGKIRAFDEIARNPGTATRGKAISRFKQRIGMLVDRTPIPLTHQRVPLGRRLELMLRPPMSFSHQPQNSLG